MKLYTNSQKIISIVIDFSAIAVFFKQQQYKFPQIQHSKYKDRAVHPLSQLCILQIPLFPQNLLISPISSSLPCLLNLRFLIPLF